MFTPHRCSLMDFRVPQAGEVGVLAAALPLPGAFAEAALQLPAGTLGDRMHPAGRSRR
jgi:hypothetical protein